MNLKRKSVRRDYSVWLLALPGGLLLALFVVLPFLMSLYLSFTSERLLPRPISSALVGLRNYERVLTDAEFWQAVANTVYFTVVVVPVQLALALAAALLLNSRIKGIALLRTVAILPLLVPITVVAVLWAALLQTPDGLLNSVYQWVSGSVGHIDWLGSSATAMLSMVMLSVWASFPFQMLVYLAGLQEIPAHHYEVAAIEGFSRWQELCYITLPGLRNVSVFLVIATTVGALGLFAQVNILTGGGPDGATTTLIQYMFDKGFSAQKIGYASTVSVIFFIAVASLALALRRLMRAK
ncbi:MAG: sugar ABC transporter permease [Gammaproteobacteria bacterium]|nr:sugar ABC transporter permease [Pseudomonadota bacterium]MCH9662569.1 sugar ABC transporter permease [Gammaproteobacteria bacterium]